MVLRINGLVAFFFIWCTLQDVSTEDTFSRDGFEEIKDSDMDFDIVKGTRDSEIPILKSNATPNSADDPEGRIFDTNQIKITNGLERKVY